MTMNTATNNRYYAALVSRDAGYEGVFYVGVTTTGVFCRPTCPARKPKREHCEFFADARQALLASFRPCKRCRPLSHPDETSQVIKDLVDAVEQEPAKRWRNEDFQALHIDASTARRQFKKRFGMTFVEYARARRMGLAFKQIRAGSPVIDAQLDAGYQSASGFRDAFSKIMGAPPRARPTTMLSATWIDAHLGPMVAVADESALYLLEFVDRRGLEREIERLRQRARSAIVPGQTAIARQISQELTEYFRGTRKQFSTPTAYLGSPFQQSVWRALTEIPAGETRSYSELAQSLGRPEAVRAVARANGANQLAIIVPCHRVIGADGGLTGYGGGLARKQWLLDHEQSTATNIPSPVASTAEVKRF